MTTSKEKANKSLFCINSSTTYIDIYNMFVCLFLFQRNLGGELTDLRSSVEPADQVRCNVIISHVGGWTEIAQFENGLWFVHLQQ